MRGNCVRDALKVGELSARESVTTPSQVLDAFGERCRDWTGAAYRDDVIASTVKAQSGLQNVATKRRRRKP
jgi:hypothetical protein